MLALLTSDTCFFLSSCSVCRDFSAESSRACSWLARERWRETSALAVDREVLELCSSASSDLIMSFVVLPLSVNSSRSVQDCKGKIYVHIKTPTYIIIIWIVGVMTMSQHQPNAYTHAVSRLSLIRPYELYGYLGISVVSFGTD